jgi:outer membrane protein assembly factor BamB
MNLKFPLRSICLAVSISFLFAACEEKRPAEPESAPPEKSAPAQQPTAPEKSAAAPQSEPAEKPATAPQPAAPAEKPATTRQAAAHGWLQWRGPTQDGISRETGLPDTVDSTKPLWVIDLPSRGTPVINGDKVYVLGYQGEGPDLQQVLRCIEADTGKTIWEQRFNDFLSDIVYERYSIGSPAIDPQTGNVYVLSSAGEFAAFTADGKELWRHSMMEDYGRLTFPNGRVGSPVIDEDLVIVRGITSNWGAQGPAADRFYAFDKTSGEIVWESTPGTVPPKDSSFSTPLLAWQNGKRVFYAGTGDGCIVCANARTGDPIWQYKFSAGGVNGTPVLIDGAVVAGHEDENLDSSELGRTLAVKIGAEPKPGEAGPVVLDKGAEVWRTGEVLRTSTPTLVNGKVYEVTKVGELVCIDAKSGKIDWRMKLGADQLHASPVYGDGKLYIPVRFGTEKAGAGEEAGGAAVTGATGVFYIIKPTEKTGEVLCRVSLEGEALGSPAIWSGRIYVSTNKKLYCFGKAGAGSAPPAAPEPEKAPTPGEVTQIQVVPCEVALRAGEKQSFKLRGLDANGLFVKELTGGEWKHFIPPTAKVKSQMDAEFDDKGELVAKPDAKISAGAWQVTVGNLRGTMRGRVLPSVPYSEDFEKFQLAEQPDGPPGVQFAYPPLAWIGARLKWDIRDKDGTKVLNKTINVPLFQRAYTFIGDSRLNNYTVEADVMTDGNRRMMSNVGVINQRYVINLVGNYKQLEVLSNQDRIKVGAPFPIEPKTWYHIKSRVDVADDGSGVVRAKAWKKGDAEPEKWTIEVPHKHAHTHGSPGVYGFALQNQFPVYVDNISVTPNK